MASWLWLSGWLAGWLAYSVWLGAPGVAAKWRAARERWQPASARERNLNARSGQMYDLLLAAAAAAQFNCDESEWVGEERRGVGEWVVGQRRSRNKAGSVRLEDWGVALARVNHIAGVRPFTCNLKTSSMFLENWLKCLSFCWLLVAQSAIVYLCVWWSQTFGVLLIIVRWEQNQKGLEFGNLKPLSYEDFCFEVLWTFASFSHPV